MEAPAYGYDWDYSAKLAMGIATFDPSCTTPTTITIEPVGWLPGTDLPEKMGFDGVPYTPDSTSTNSPWMESLVFPENPSGVIKTPQGPVERRICDACYIYPMFFGMNNWEIPEAPECMAWAGSVTKLYSASVRAGYVIYKNDDPDWVALMEAASGAVRSMADGLMSEWTWWGQIQILDQLMTKPYTDPTSWIGAYITIMEEKWTTLINGFSGCGDYIEITNPSAGAYVWFMLKGDAVGMEEGDWLSSFFGEVLGVKTTTYSWGFRGANPADYYGAGYSVYDFVRLQLFRDVNVYHEVARRAALVCADPLASVDGYLTIPEWLTTGRRRRRALKEGGAVDHAAHLHAAAPRLSDNQVQRLVAKRAEADAIGAAVEEHCAPMYTSTCLQKHSQPRSSADKVKPTRRKLKSLGKPAVKKARKLASTKHVAPKHDHRELAVMDVYSKAADCVAQMYKASPYSPCPAESFYWEHDPAVYGGYSGCVGENGLMPCAQDGFEGMDGSTGLMKPYVWDEDTATCVESGYTSETETYWILWGHPQDTYELTKRTGSAPVVTFPLVRGPYPSYKGDDHGDDAADLYPKIKEWLAYLGAFTEEQLEGFDVDASEGAEQGVAVQMAAMAAKIATESCAPPPALAAHAPRCTHAPLGPCEPCDRPL